MSTIVVCGGVVFHPEPRRATTPDAPSLDLGISGITMVRIGPLEGFDVASNRIANSLSEEGSSTLKSAFSEAV
jgi:hypothetical protein